MAKTQAQKDKRKAKRALKKATQGKRGPKGPGPRGPNGGGKGKNIPNNLPGAMSTAPVAYNKIVKTGKQKMQTMSNGDCRIIHREYINDILASTASAPTPFSTNAYPINPGQVQTFPWLSQIAQRFESYRFDALKFCFETEAATSLGGSMILSVDYDASDPAPLTKQQAMAYRSSVRSAPWQDACHTSLSEDLHKLKTFFVRPGGQTSGTDIKTYDTGNFFISTQNILTSAAVCGELYVEYNVLLMTPVFENSSFDSGTVTTAAATSANPILNGVALGSIAISSSGSTLAFAGIIPGQEYLLTYNNTGTATCTFIVGNGFVHKTDFNAGGVNSVASTYTAISDVANPQYTISCALSAATTGVLVTMQQIPTSAY